MELKDRKIEFGDKLQREYAKIYHQMLGKLKNTPKLMSEKIANTEKESKTLPHGHIYKHSWKDSLPSWLSRFL